MAEASRGSKGTALVLYQGGIGDGDAKVYRFQVLLPSGMSTSLTLRNPGEEMLVHDLLLSVKKELNNGHMGADGRLEEIQWSGNIYLTDLLDRKFTNKIKLSYFDTKSINILRLHDGKGAIVSTFENMWDLTPQTDLLQELPAEYSIESALVDLTDNALQALWSNGNEERKLIKITVDKEKIVIFDTGKGMDGSDGNSIAKWGTMGSSNHRVFREKGIGGKAPYLLPFFGMFGYGGTIASMHLGRKVFILHLSREVLLKQPLSENSKCTWKTAGGVRDPSKEEILLSPHQSFTKVEICGLKGHLEAPKLHGFLKDIYFPYIQYDEDNASMNTRNPVEFQVNGVNLAEIQEGEVTITNLHSSNGPDFVLHLKFSQVTAGKESIDSILEKLSNDAYGVKENFDNFSRVSIRRLGRLLPDARWGPLPFMEPKYRKGPKAEFFKRCCKRVKCFVETDAGFSPTLSKTDLAQHNPFTKALRCLGSNYSNDCSAMKVKVEVCGQDGRVLSLKQLEKQYQDWIKKMHDMYDVEVDAGDDEPTLVINPRSKERLGISNDVEVIRVYTSISRKGQTWMKGDHLKIHPGVTGRMKNSCHSLKTPLYTTLEYILVEGLQGDVCGEARIICRPIEFSDEQGCLIDEAESPNIYIQESVSFPVSIIDNAKCQKMDDDAWNKMLKKKTEKAPAGIEVIRNLENNALGIVGDLPFEDVVTAGYQPPHELVAVIRPGNYIPCSTGLLDQKYIVKDDELEMVMEIHLSSSKDHPRVELIHNSMKKPSSRNDINGLYFFPLREASSIFSKSGVYLFIFSVRCRDSRVIQHKTEIRVCPDPNSRCWQIFSVADHSAYNTPVEIRLGCPVRCLAVKSVDSYGNRIPFLDISNVIISVLDGDDIIAQVDDIKVELSSDALTLKAKDFMFKTSKLDILRPKYEANLKICSSDSEFSGICPCKVKPGFPSTIKMDMSLGSEKNLTPGRMIDNVLLEVFDHCSNHVEEGTELNVRVDGLSFQDKRGSVLQVNSAGLIDLSGALKVVSSFGSYACLTIFHDEKKIFSETFQIAIRELKAVDVPESCPAGSLLENIMFEVSDIDGVIDESIDGPLHTLIITMNGLPLLEGAQYAFKLGRCVVSNVQVPHEQGIVNIVAYHTHYPELRTTVQLQVHALDLVLSSVEEGPEPILSYPISSIPNSDLLFHSQLTPEHNFHLAEYIKDVIEKTTDEIDDTHSKMISEQKMIEALYSRKKALEDEITNLKDEIGPTVGSLINAMELTRHKIVENIGTAASVLCSISSGEHFIDDVIGVVALLGTVTDSKISRMLAVYLGKEDMLAVVCKTQDAANYIEKYDMDGNVKLDSGIHSEAAALGVPINKRFTIICLDAIEPYKGGLLWNSTQKELALPCPFPNLKKPNGFSGFAVNMINLSDENLNISTGSGYGLRETLFYSLFGELQVYETRKDMLQALPYLKGGAISLDGGVIKGNGKLLLGYSDPKITFPVITLSPNTLDFSEGSQDIVTKTNLLDANMRLLKKMEDNISKREESLNELFEKFNKKKRKFDKISEVIEPCSSQLNQLTPVQTPGKSHFKAEVP
ncbi:hypothetical protein ACP70R_022013 [Stipagrostis hirtigluma subsp. patula]